MHPSFRLGEMPMIWKCPLKNCVGEVDSALGTLNVGWYLKKVYSSGSVDGFVSVCECMYTRQTTHTLFWMRD